MQPQDKDYATPQRLAIYLEIGWSDFLYEPPQISTSAKDHSYPDPLRDHVPPSFPIGVAELARVWATDTGLDVRRFCDVGGSVGRTLFEIEQRFSALQQLVLVEPSERFCEWAELLLSSDQSLPDVPVMGRIGSPLWVAARIRPSPIPHAKERLTIVHGTLESYRPTGGFDLVTCLNVIDRHPRPSGVVDELGRLMNQNGLLILSCPFDFSESSTPDPATWIDDLNDLFAGKDAWDHVGQDELLYEFRSYNRSWTRFSTQIVAKRWRAG